ncbi:MAG: BspA family leucine-rich repeat surface protein [Bacteroidota bacterium]
MIKTVNRFLVVAFALFAFFACSKDDDIVQYDTAEDDTSVDTPNPFTTRWETKTDNEAITIYANDAVTGYNYEIDWGDGNTESNLTGDATHEYALAGVHTVIISGDFPAIYQEDETNAGKLVSIEQWGDMEWESMEMAFANCTNMTHGANDVPDLSKVTDMSNMFRSAASFNGNINNWDVSNVINMLAVFFFASAFNQDLSEWDVSNAMDMRWMFSNATAFDQDVGNWDVSKVTTMRSMFSEATSFNQDIGKWNVISVTSMQTMFFGATAFDQDLSDWEVDNVTECNNFATGSAISLLHMPSNGSCVFVIF